MLKRKMAVLGHFLHQLLEPPSANCAKFSCESSRDGLKCQTPQKWAKNAKNLLRQKIGLRVKNRGDVKKKNGRFWVFPPSFFDIE